MTLDRAAQLLNVVPAWLDALIRFESGWNPLARNPISGARGLIQVTNTTARSFFRVDSADALVEQFPDRESQLENVVVPYLQRYAPFPTRQSLYMSVFYPAYRAAPPDTVFSDSIQKQNPNIKTVQDYINLVNRRLDPVKVGFAGLAIVGLLLLWYYSGRGGL